MVDNISAFSKHWIQCLVWLTWIIALAISFRTTWIGIDTILESTVEAMTFSAIITVTQGMSCLKLLARGGHGPSGKASRVLAFLAYLICLLVSVGFGLLKSDPEPKLGGILTTSLAINATVELMILTIAFLMTAHTENVDAGPDRHPLIPHRGGIGSDVARSPIEEARLVTDFANTTCSRSGAIGAAFRRYVDLSGRYLVLPPDSQEPDVALIRFFISLHPTPFQLLSTRRSAKRWAGQLAHSKNIRRDRAQDGEGRSRSAVVHLYWIPGDLLSKILHWDLKLHTFKNSSSVPTETPLDAPENERPAASVVARPLEPASLASGTGGNGSAGGSDAR